MTNKDYPSRPQAYFRPGPYIYWHIVIFSGPNGQCNNRRTKGWNKNLCLKWSHCEIHQQSGTHRGFYTSHSCSNCPSNSTHRLKLHPTTYQFSQITAKELEEQNDEIETLKKSKSELQQRVDDLEYDLDNLEQYSTSLRFHNVPKPGTDESNTDTESAVISICEKMRITITSDDIDRSHPKGRPNRNNKLQIICKLKHG